MPSDVEYKLTYFNMMGRAEPTRLIFAAAAVPYEDHRIEKSEWPALKEKMPNGQLPVLYVDGKPLAQSRAIEKYLGKQFGLAGKNDWEAAKMDELVLSVEDLLIKMKAWFSEEDSAKKVEIFRTLCETEITPFLNRFDHHLAQNDTGFFVGNKLSYADLAIFHIFWFMNHKILPGALRKYSHLDEFVSKISEMPSIKQWIEKRPKTEA